MRESLHTARNYKACMRELIVAPQKVMARVGALISYSDLFAGYVTQCRCPLSDRSAV